MYPNGWLNKLTQKKGLTEISMCCKLKSYLCNSLIRFEIVFIVLLIDFTVFTVLVLTYN